MERVKKELYRLLCIPNRYLALIAVAVVMGMILKNGNDFILTLSCAGAFYVFVCLLMRTKELYTKLHVWWMQFCNTNPILVRYDQDEWFRTKVILTNTSIGGGIIVLYHLILGMFYHTIWYYTMAGYNLLLTVMRVLLMRHNARYAPGQELDKELKLSGFCGLLFLLMNVALTAIVQYVITQGHDFSHPMVITIAMAAYTFAAFGLAVSNMIRYRKSKSPVIYMSKYIPMAAACVSVLILEKSMLATFGANTDPLFDQRMLAGTGAGVAVVLFWMSGSILFRTIRGLDKRRNLQ